MTGIAQRLFQHIRWQGLLHAGERVGVAVSGGIDSVALLRLMLELRGELGIVLSVVHFNHKLRGQESEGDEQFVAGIARVHGLEFYCDSDDVAGHAREQGVSLETAARELRYGFFRHLIREGGSPGLKPNLEGEPLRDLEGPLFHEVPEGRRTSTEHGTKHPRFDKMLTGHTLDDQAETVLMRVIRGSGLRGLGAIHPRISVERDNGEVCGEIVRPLLGIRRRELEAYLNEIGQSWREDATNAEVKFTRNRIRKLLVPLLEKEFNPSITDALAELAEIARGEEDYWDNEVAGWMGTGVHWTEPEWARKARAAGTLVHIGMGSGQQSGSHPVGKENDLVAKIENAPWLVMNASVDRVWLLGEPAAVQRRVIKAVGDEAGIPLEFKHIEEILSFAIEDGVSGGELSLPLGWKVRRESHDFLFESPDLREREESSDYQYELSRDGKVDVPELGTSVELRIVPAGTTGYNPDQLLDADSLPGPFVVRNWRAGDRFWPSHTKSPKKIKELLQEHHVALPERRLWPVVVSGNEIVWIRGFPVPQRYRARPGGETLAVLERQTES